MKETTSKSSASKPKPKSIFMLLTGIFFKFLLIVLGGAFLLGLSFILLILWKGQSIAFSAAQTLLDDNLHFIAANPSMLALKLVNPLVSFQGWITHLLQPAENIGVTLLHTFLQWVILISGIEFSRLGIFTLLLPLISLIILLSIVDGLVKRDIRKFQVARESTFLFHRPKPLLNFCFFMPVLMYFSLPFALPPTKFFICVAVTLGMITHLSLTYFRKYL